MEACMLGGLSCEVAGSEVYIFVQHPASLFWVLYSCFSNCFYVSLWILWFFSSRYVCVNVCIMCFSWCTLLLCCYLRDLLAVFLFPVSSLSSSYSTSSWCIVLGLSLNTIFSIKFPLISLRYCDPLIRILYSSRIGHNQVLSVQLVMTVVYGKMLHVCLGSCKLE